MEKYVITGIGLYNSLGQTVAESWEALLQGKSGVAEVVWPEDNEEVFPKTHKALLYHIGAKCNFDYKNIPEVFQKHWKIWDDSSRASMLSCHEALTDANFTSTNVGVMFGTFDSGIYTKNDMLASIQKGNPKYPPRKSLNIGKDYQAMQISAVYNTTGPNYALTSACVTGLAQLETAVNMLKCDTDLDGVIVGSCDFLVDPMWVYWFQNLGALSTAPCKPFDINRAGINLGEGAATIIVEPLSKALRRNAKIYGTIESVVNLTLYESATSPDPNGMGAFYSMQKALSKAGIDASDVKYVNAHATGTPVGDIVEYTAISKLFPGATVVSNKGQIGHTMGACGITELIYTALALKSNVTPGNINLTDKIGNNEVILPTESTTINSQYAVKNSFGFGGRNSSMVYKNGY